MKTSQLSKTNACCGCGACSVICPQNAISMKEDRFGFIYPSIDENMCMDCEACKKICVFSSEKEENNFTSYVCVNKNDDQIMQSASGGAFSAIATSFLKSGGYVCGAADKIENGVISVEHKIISSLDNLSELQGSKYVQSYTLNAFKEVRRLLKEGNKVLFSGTPCQVDAIKNLCKKYVGISLYTIDIICHGVPNQKFLNGYLHEYQKKQDANLIYIDFRNKKYGWGLAGISKFEHKGDIVITPKSSSYYKYFLEGETYRQNCYECTYANMKRVGDITIGDYWGFQELSPELNDKPEISEKKGVSCLIINNEIGHNLLNEFETGVFLYPVEIEKVMQINKQLREPAKHTSKRKYLMETFANKGYAPIEREFQKQLLIIRGKETIKHFIPKSVKGTIKKIVKKISLL